ncbi:hypothetical protein GUITHDRAFT_109756 [Guillardia theta CCMP2712]|uniref:Uncharacterized protein n=1 Tax=Guillardia theta (strain CCMP2712) TaxID=905079 RepID=L1J717_GUITC|nr:hypothetical protein GUITHDRAFT_109756 [Guillardia theta CCMP2712]EKX44301.1 hypothetical protein GUITHDRAFT_109756 [Guillardia theta CCMP2712]|eukprot:XP_005831281.1 hypothetical protein GUITHDRAFT_109756 [Guillardia theta CCMP2712]
MKRMVPSMRCHVLLTLAAAATAATSSPGRLPPDLLRRQTFFEEQARRCVKAEDTSVLIGLYQREMEEIQRLAEEKEKLDQRRSEEIQRLVKDKRDEAKRLVKAMKKCEKHYTRNLADLSERVLYVDAQRVAVLNNRALIEIGIRRITSELSLSAGVRRIVNKHLLQTSKQGKMLSMHSKRVCKELGQYDFLTDEQSVMKELTVLRHEISKPLHNLAHQKILPRGYYVGGSSPLAQAVACMITYLQSEGKISKVLPVLVIGEDGEPREKGLRKNDSLI